MHSPVSRALGALAAVVGALGCRAAPGGGTAGHGPLVISRAAVSISPDGAPAPAFLRLDNRGTAADTLLGVGSPDADSVILHTMVAGQMEHVPLLVIPAGARVRLRPGSYHLMLEGVRPLSLGDTVTLVLRFAMAGEVSVRTPALRYSDAVRE
jgi:copper(I)-binding protein